jgi:acetyl-CoA carboxylase carboxyl transferase subunit alpha
MPPSEHELRLRERLGRLRNLPLLGGARLSGELERLQRQIDRIGDEATDDDIWRRVELARHDDRPYTLDYVERLLEDWFELHGDRGSEDDGAMVAGLGRLDGRTVVLVGHQKGRDIKERVRRQFGAPNPEGYKKAMRAMELAERHRFPIVTLVDTPGAYPGVVAEHAARSLPLARRLRLGAGLARFQEVFRQARRALSTPSTGLSPAMCASCEQ